MISDQELLRTFGKRVQKARRRKGVSQEALAHESGLHRTYIGSVERGERNISLLNILTLSMALEISPTVLVEGLKRMPQE